MLRHAPRTRPTRSGAARSPSVAPRRHYSDKPAPPPAQPAGPDVLFQTVSNGATHAQVVTLNRPKALNALNLNMIRMMYPNYRVREPRRMDALLPSLSLTRAVEVVR